jgi:hypothetical protein
MKSALRFLALGVASCSLLFPTPAHAGPVLLSTLLAGGTITCGQFTFGNFSYKHSGDFPSASGVNVVCITEVVGGKETVGLRFQGGFGTLPHDTSNAVIDYTVSVSGDGLIDLAHLAGNPVGLGGGTVNVTETFKPEEPSVLRSVFAVGSHHQLSDTGMFLPGSSPLHVETVIHEVGGRKGASLSFLDETFHSVPEPSTLSLLGATGVTMLAGALRYRRRLTPGA